MGRFGNQADHFLGSLAFAKNLNRTLVLPPWIEYVTGRRGSAVVPFDSYFDVDRVRDYHRAVTMEQFFDRLAGVVWPVGRRHSFCYSERRGSAAGSCNAKDGNPFGPFWDAFNVTFDGSLMYAPLGYDVRTEEAAAKWRRAFPPEDHPVLAFTGAPAPFPVQEEHAGLQLHLVHNAAWRNRARAFVSDRLRPPFVGIHLRNGADWARACEHATGSGKQLFSSPQCLGYRNERGNLSRSLCLPGRVLIAEQLRAAVRRLGARSVFVASDDDHMIEALRESLGGETPVVRQDDVQEVHLDLAVLSEAQHFIGNCVSSFSAFVKRARDARGLSSSFWAFSEEDGSQHVEL